MLEPHVLQLIMDSLRYWIDEMHVDGFRFDLASALARELHAVDRLSAFFDIIQQDPVIRTVKLIAEPWDVGEGGYQVGEFPAHWAEWNGRYRDTVRDLWRGQPDMLHDFGRRFTGSADLYQDDGRRPSASVNLVTAHDGFTLADLVSYDRKHNRANGDDDRDGESHNRSWNCGAEGPTDDPAILALRARQQRNLLATLFLSQGVPMLLGGDELGRTQAGNNNAYCHDSELSWYDWARRRRGAPGLHAPPHRAASRPPGLPPSPLVPATGARSRMASGPCPTSTGASRGGRACATTDWHADGATAIAVFLSGRHLVDDDGRPRDGRLLLPLPERRRGGPRRSACPARSSARAGSAVLDTAAGEPFGPRAGQPARTAGGRSLVTAHSLVLLRSLA